MRHFIRGFNFLELSLDERTLLAHELLASVRSEIQTLPLPAEQRTAIEHRLAQVGTDAIAA